MNLYYKVNGKRIDVPPDEAERVTNTLLSFTGLDQVMLYTCLRDNGLKIPSIDGERTYFCD